MKPAQRRLLKKLAKPEYTLFFYPESNRVVLEFRDGPVLWRERVVAKTFHSLVHKGLIEHNEMGYPRFNIWEERYSITPEGYLHSDEAARDERHPWVWRRQPDGSKLLRNDFTYPSTRVTLHLVEGVSKRWFIRMEHTSTGEMVESGQGYTLIEAKMRGMKCAVSRDWLGRLGLMGDGLRVYRIGNAFMIAEPRSAHRAVDEDLGRCYTPFDAFRRAAEAAQRWAKENQCSALVVDKRPRHYMPRLNAEYTGE